MTASPELQETIEFYFSDANLWRSAFFRNEMNARADASFPLAKLLDCNRVRQLTASLAAPLDAVRDAVRASSLLRLVQDASAVQRVTPLPPKPSDYKVAHRTVFVDQLSADDCREGAIKSRLEAAFGVGAVLYVDVSRRNGQPRGYAFVEMRDELTSLRAANRAAWALTDSPLFGWRVLTHTEFMRRSNIFRSLSQPPPPAIATDDNNDNNNTTATTATSSQRVPQPQKMAMSASPLERGQLLHVDGIEASLSTADLRATFETIALVAYIDRSDSDPTRAIVRYHTAADRNRALKELAGKFRQLRALEGAEETDYLARAAEQRAKRRAEFDSTKIKKHEPAVDDDGAKGAKKKRRNKRKSAKSKHVRLDDDDEQQEQRERQPEPESSSSDDSGPPDEVSSKTAPQNPH
jgi:hypothetical protein